LRIQTERLVLKRRMLWHLPRLVDVYRDPRTLTHLGGPVTLWVAYRRLVQGCFGGRHWTLFRCGSRRPIGTVGFWTWSDGRPELVYWVAPDFWRSGVATEAIAAALSAEPRRPVVALSRVENLGSCLVLEKFGFTVEADLWRYDAEQRLYVLR
jgi:RimJ/RimL family protein N-acetyltransferase